ncbi:MAG: threonine--tRNA ligase, partial [Pseudolabrys sp.]
WYRENMFAAQSAGDEAEDKRWFAIKPMNCPGHVLIFKHGLKSYRELPIRLAEFGIVHRYEPSGAMHGLMRVRGFTQDDAHIFCTEDQLADECLKINDLIMSTYADFGFDGEMTVKLSTRPEKRVGSDAAWDHAESVMADVLKRIAASNNRIKTSINPGEGAFYGPKFEYVLRDAIGRDWQCGTTQVDFNLPERFGAFYIDADGAKKTPVRWHRASCGSLERFTGILLEHYAGHMPLWLAPQQAMVATITSDGDDYAKEVLAAARAAGLRVGIDLRNEKINYKVREHSLAKVPALLVVGKKEAAERTVSIRRLGKEGQQVLPLDEALKLLKDDATPPDVKRVEKAHTHTDALTGLPNLQAFEAQLSQLLKINEISPWLHVGVMCIDVRRADTISDSPADGLVKEAANRLTSLVQEREMTARIGETFFGVIVPQTEQLSSLIDFGEKLATGMNGSYVMDGLITLTKTKVGISVSLGHGTISSDLINKAVLACEHIRDSKRVSLFEPWMKTASLDHHLQKNPSRSSGATHAISPNHRSLPPPSGSSDDF